MMEWHESACLACTPAPQPTGYQSFPQPEENAQHVNRDMVADEITKGVLY